ncbi:MAG: hypothetical protein K6B75_04390 [Lachnospiraceae bacterium]|nr:hypothetical protein [Lachnospiraceae bacterium]
MMKLKKLLALGLAFCMVASFGACGDKNTEDTGNNSGTGTNTNTNTNKNSEKNEEVTIGTWWVQYYDSSATSLSDNPQYDKDMAAEETDENAIAQKADNKKAYEMKFENVKKIEEKYGVKFYWDNLTYTGVKDSINTSIIAGTPDCDVYLVEASFGIPAQMSGLCTNLKDVLPADSDIFTTQSNAAYLDLGDGKACIFYRVDGGESTVAATYPLAFNVQMLEDNNLEDPRVLWEKGEWTWSKFIEYAKILTQDTDGDGQTDQYGYCGYEAETLDQLLMSNGTAIASTSKENLSSSEVGEVLQMIYDMYNVHKICYPYDYEGSPSDSMRNQYTEGNIAFFPCAAWIQSGNEDYGGDTELDFDIAYVRWPVGPSGNKDTNPGKNGLSGEFYIIPAGVAEPEKVFNVMNDYWNWYDGDTSIRDSKNILHWWYESTAKDPELQVENYEVMKDCGSHLVIDLGVDGTLGDGTYLPLQNLMQGLTTPAQIQEEYKQVFQDALDAYFGN